VGPERDAHFYAEGVRRGGTLVTARVDDARASAAREILLRYKAVDPTVRGAAYGKPAGLRSTKRRPLTLPTKSQRSAHAISEGASK
jgi:hypothetical protein